ncbi:Heme exporter protein C [Candidatus Arcanobacter lacustris]|uniref:Heme exporter protein C n=1 Tax=Candidatus Arcanibacter lacustris TaxID=1607817 RepID=A0A0F5MPY5_9RICK|nr:Heme exporter protein C [Candidatus Arcanobacter lacustris]
MHKYFTPYYFAKIADGLIVFFAIMSLSLFAVGLYWALVVSPADYQQGEAVRIMYIHVPAAWMSLFIYSFMASSSVSYLIWRSNFADIIARKSALIGCNFTFITLVTGSMWGKPIWGAWWVWDARLTSLLILFFFYLGYIAIDLSSKNREKTAISLAILAIIGFVNVPIVKFSVDFWNSLHQPASIIRSGGSAIDPSMLKPLLVMALACLFYFFWILFIRVKSEIINHKIQRLQSKYFY